MWGTGLLSLGLQVFCLYLYTDESWLVMSVLREDLVLSAVYQTPDQI